MKKNLIKNRYISKSCKHVNFFLRVRVRMPASSTSGFAVGEMPMSLVSCYEVVK